MTVDQYIALLRTQTESVKRAYFLAVSSTHAQVSQRIFEKGDLGGKKKYKSAGYKVKREKRGRQTGFVDLKFEGFMQNDFTNSLLKISDFKYQTGFKNAQNSRKADRHIKRYGDFFVLKNVERNHLRKTFSDNLAR